VNRSSWIKYAAAAAILLLTGLATWLFVNKPGKLDIVVNKHEVDLAPPSSSTAVITLSDGKQIVLDSMQNGLMATEGTVRVQKLPDGKIAYTGNAEVVQYNTLTNPAGSRVVNITLADGSMVWLNAASSITYPTAFSGVERKVTVNGEAYFEV